MGLISWDYPFNGLILGLKFTSTSAGATSETKKSLPPVFATQEILHGMDGMDGMDGMGGMS